MKTVRIPIYGGRLIVANSQDEFNRAYKRLLAGHGFEHIDKSPALCPGGITSSEVIGDDLVIISGAFDGSGGTRCHEATHCAQAVAGVVGMDPIQEREAFAYLVQWFYEELGR